MGSSCVHCVIMEENEHPGYIISPGVGEILYKPGMMSNPTVKTRTASRLGLFIE